MNHRPISLLIRMEDANFADYLESVAAGEGGSAGTSQGLSRRVGPKPMRQPGLLL
jgi:hypothetical protein